MPLSVFYYFGGKPFPLKQKHPLNYTIKFFYFLPSSTKRLFFRNKKHKRTTQAALSPLFQYSILFLPLYSYTITKTAYTITETLIQSRKLTGSFCVRIRVLPDSIDFCLIVQRFPCKYPSFRDNNRLLPTSIYYQAKQPQNKSSYSR